MDARTRLIEVALDQFARHGYEAVGVQQIVDAASVTKPTLYHHFGSKLGLLQTLVAERAVGLAAALEERAPYRRGDLDGTLRTVVDVFAQYAASQPAMYRLELALFFAAPDNEGHRTIEPVFRARKDALDRLFSAAAQDHGNLRRHLGSLSASLIGVIQMQLIAVIDGRANFDRRARGELVHRFSHGIYS